MALREDTTEIMREQYRMTWTGWPHPLVAGVALTLGLAFAPSLLSGQADDPPRTIQPGAPGESSRVLDADELRFEFPKHVEADVHFIRMMIEHHAQALEMSALAPDRAERADVRLLAHRIHTAQLDEIALMAQWLHRRGEDVPGTAYELGFDPHDTDHEAHDTDHGSHHAHDPDHGSHHAHDTDHDAHHAHGDRDHGAHHGHEMDHHAHHADESGHHAMPGMLSPEQLARLAASTGEEFDRLFLEFMIFHHEGAILMVRELFDSAEGGQEGEIFQFASHVDSDQRIEIERMRTMLADGS